MRVSSYSFTRYAVDAINDKQASIAKLQMEISTGKKLLSPSDSPSEVATAENLTASVLRVDQYAKNTTMASQRLEQEESVLDNVSNALLRIKELAIQANTGVLNDGDRASIEAETLAIRDQLMDYANTQTPNGDFLFAGSKGATRPFTENGGNVVYNGDQTERYVQISDSRRVKSSDSGDKLFMRILDGNGNFSTSADSANTGTGRISAGSMNAISSYANEAHSIEFTSATAYDIKDSAGTVISSGSYNDGSAINFNGIEVAISGAPASGDQFYIQPAQNKGMFAFVDDFITALSAPRTSNPDTAKYHQAVGNTLGNLDRAIEHVQSRRSELGSRMSYVDSTIEENDSLKYLLNKTRSEIEDTDFAKAASDLQYQMTTLDAVRKSYLQMQNMSLFDYM